MEDESADRDHLYTLREVHLDALNRFQEEIDDEEQFYQFTVGGMKARLERMKAHMERMEKAHILYRQCTLVSSDLVYIDAEKMYLRLVAKLETRIQELEFERHPPRANSTMNQIDHSVIRLEQMRKPQIGKFNGTPSDWPAFRDLFLAEVHNRHFDPVTKLLYLREACVDSAADTLGPWQPTAANYELAWQSMIAAYDDEYHVIHAILGKMHATKRHDEESHASLRAILDSLNGGTRQLETITSHTVLLDQIWIHFAKQRLPATTLDAWEQYRNRERSTALPTLEEFKNFLDSKAKARREFESKNELVPQAMEKLRNQPQDGKMKDTSGANRFKPYDRNRKGSGPSQANSHGFAPPAACIMTGCEAVHYLGQCPQFIKLNFEQRQKIVKDHQRCRCCLGEGHMAATCRRRGCSKCPEAKSKHHYWLCTKTHRGNQSANDSNQAAPARH